MIIEPDIAKMVFLFKSAKHLVNEYKKQLTVLLSMHCQGCHNKPYCWDNDFQLAQFDKFNKCMNYITGPDTSPLD